MKHLKYFYFAVLTSACCLGGSCSQQNSPRKENAYAPGLLEENIISSMGIYTFYAQQDSMRLFMPYTYMMNKYLDLAIGYINGDWNTVNLATPINMKQAEVDAYAVNNAYLENEYLCSSDFDCFFDQLYDSLIVELNSYAIVQSRMAESIEISGTDSADYDYLDIMIPLGDNIYSKLDILYFHENHYLMPHEAFDEDVVIETAGCDCAPSYSPAREQTQPNKLSRASWRMLWLDDIRYRNYKNQCPHMTDLTGAMATWEAASNYAIHFREISDNGWNRFTWGIGCNYHVCLSLSNDNSASNSTLGCVPWAMIHLSDYADTGSCLHELGHTLGLIHEHCRPDRDCYIDIDWNSILSNYKHNFEKEWCTSATMYGIFDFESIMMYSSWAFSYDDVTPTMRKKDGSVFYANRDHLSDNDILYIKYLYHE